MGETEAMPLDEILAGSPRAAQSLLASDHEAWKVLLEHAVANPNERAPLALVEAMLGLDPDVGTWLERAKNCAALLWITPLPKTMRPFRAWLLAGMEASETGATSARFESLRADRSDEALDEIRALVATLRGDASASSAMLLARALKLLAYRALERGHGQEALSVATELEATIANPASKEHRAARRLRAAALLRMARFSEGFALLDELLHVPGPFAGGAGASAVRFIADPREAALDELAAQATALSRLTPEWVRALGEVAETHLGTQSADELASRFDDALSALAARDDSAAVQTDLETVIRQALERNLTRTAEAAARRLPLREIADRGASGAHLILRLRAKSGAWLRIHDDKTLELAVGDARRDESRSSLPPLASDDSLWADALTLANTLRRHLEPRDLTAAAPWPRSYPVQVFRGAPTSFVEGYVGVESDMGQRSDVFGLRDPSSAHASAQTLQRLLSLTEQR